ncbi:MAG: SOS response-associated peptidase [Halobacteria archaeon]|nr:SOS response-associated peptidase [Halobacteria archaeon]
MCGRFTLHTPPEVLREHFGVGTVPDTAASYNVAPSQMVSAVRAADRHREMVLLRWGLIPSWAKETRVGYRMINARAETVADKPAYRAAFRRRRCLIPADGFYEWQQTGTGKQPWYIRMKQGGVFAFAGLWEHWEGKDEVVESCNIIVTEANASVRPVHDRMPVIIDPSDYELWLDLKIQQADALNPLLRPYPAGEMIAYPVSKGVNSPANNDAHCIEAVDV